MSKEPMKQADPIKVEISDEMLKRLEEIPDSKTGQKARVFTPEEDAIILRYWKRKRKADVAKLLGVHENTARRRYEELTAED